jgi:glycosyltransferase involved in cell wall biosynthesis
MTLVSVITPAFRAEPHLARAVRSVLAQSWTDWEMLIVSNDGADYRRVIAEAGLRDPRLRFLSMPRPGLGPGAGRNRALAEARGRYLAPLDADDLFYPQRLARLVPLAEAHGMAGDNVRVVEDPGGAVVGSLRAEGPGTHWLGLRDYAATSVPMTFVLRRDRVTWRWEEGIGFAEDTLFNLRGLEACGPVPVTGTALHEYRVRPGSLCHGPDSAERAERGYAWALDALARHRLGFRTPQARLLVREMLLARQRLNRAFQTSQAAGQCRTFQEFIASRATAAAAA